MNNFGEIFKYLRLEYNLSQKIMAEKLNVDQTTISTWENGRREPDYNTLMLIADYFDVSTDYLLGRDELIDIPIVARRGDFQTIKANKAELKRDLEELERANKDAIENLRKKLDE